MFKIIWKIKGDRKWLFKFYGRDWVWLGIDKILVEGSKLEAEGAFGLWKKFKFGLKNVIKAYEIAEREIRRTKCDCNGDMGFEFGRDVGLE